MLRLLRIKFICINMVIVTVMLTVIFGLVLHFTQQNLEQQSVQMMQTVGGAPTPPERPGERPDAIHLPHFIISFSSSLEILEVDGSYYDLSDRELLHTLMDQALSTQERTGIIKEYGLRFCRMPTPFGEKLVFADISSEISTMRDLLRICFLIGILGLLVFFFISLFLARWAIRPVELAWQQQRQFVADASHELKTPLTVITTNAELLESSLHNPEQSRLCTEHILTMSYQMRGLVESLLELARVDNGRMNMAFSELNFSQLANSTVLPFDAVFFEKNLTLDCQVQDGIQVRGSAQHLRQVIEILLDNAQKYSDPHTTVSLQLRKLGHNLCQLSVSNRGPAISQEDLCNIFKRFYRVDAVRSMNHSYGLGLPIARQIVLAHKGKIRAESRNGVNTFTIHLPIL